DAGKQLLEGALDQASRAMQLVWAAAGTDHEGHRRLHGSGCDRATEGRELRRLAPRELREYVRRNVPDGIHDQIPHHRCAQSEHAMDRSAALSTEARGSTPRRAEAQYSRRPLHQSLSVSDARRLQIVSASVRAHGRHALVSPGEKDRLQTKAVVLR